MGSQIKSRRVRPNSGDLVKLMHDVETFSGRKFSAGEVFRVASRYRCRLNLIKPRSKMTAIAANVPVNAVKLVERVVEED